MMETAIEESIELTNKKELERLEKRKNTST